MSNFTGLFLEATVKEPYIYIFYVHMNVYSIDVYIVYIVV